MDVAALIIGIISLIIAGITFIKTESYKRRLRIELSRIVTDSHGFRWEIMQHIQKLDKPTLDLLQGRIDSFNDEIFRSLLSLDKKLAHDWIAINKKDATGKIDWDYYGSIFQYKFTENTK